MTPLWRAASTQLMPMKMRRVSTPGLAASCSFKASPSATQRSAFLDETKSTISTVRGSNIRITIPHFVPRMIDPRTSLPEATKVRYYLLANCLQFKRNHDRHPSHHRPSKKIPQPEFVCISHPEGSAFYWLSVILDIMASKKMSYALKYEPNIYKVSLIFYEQFLESRSILVY